MTFFPHKLKEILDKNKKTQEEIDKYQSGIELEKGDFLAMVIAAIITFLPVLIVAMVVIYGLAWILLVR